MNSLIDDVNLRSSFIDRGPILFTNQQIRRMLKLADANEDDVFYDLGCGWGQNLIVAATEFNVRKCVGLESASYRYKKAKDRVEKWISRSRLHRNQIVIKNSFFQNAVEDGSIKEATIIFYGLQTDKSIVEDISPKLQNGTKLLYYYLTLFPEIMPDSVDFPFYLSKTPFQKPKSELEWLLSVIQKEKSTLHSKRPNEKELWEELSHDYGTQWFTRKEIKESVGSYRSRLEAVIKSRSIK